MVKLIAACSILLCVQSCAQTKKTAASAPVASTLKEAYKNIFLMGTAVNQDIVSGSNKPLQNIVLTHFNTITPENVMKAALINPEPGVYNYGPSDAFVDFGKQNNMFIIGHTLVWHNQVPAWFFKNGGGNPNTKEEQLERAPVALLLCLDYRR
ncbi:MAG: endo-1,4-beta-xylanase, partial [Pedobacter sp.]